MNTAILDARIYFKPLPAALHTAARLDVEWSALEKAQHRWECLEARGSCAEASAAWAAFVRLDRRVYGRAARSLRCPALRAEEPRVRVSYAQVDDPVLRSRAISILRALLNRSA